MFTCLGAPAFSMDVNYGMLKMLNWHGVKWLVSNNFLNSETTQLYLVKSRLLEIENYPNLPVALNFFLQIISILKRQMKAEVGVKAC